VAAVDAEAANGTADVGPCGWHAASNKAAAETGRYLRMALGDGFEQPELIVRPNYQRLSAAL